jgi:hypothetical protein
MPILERASRSSHDQEFERRLKRAARILAEQPTLREAQLARLLAAREGTTAFDTICASECAFAQRGWLSDRRTWPEYAQTRQQRAA